ncbi:MAG: SH3 beta-barrel fold-containing protein [Bacteroidales bacterium]|nr:SH3 beta-barrel fold-containing protein [Bacteroidales bacterium]
MSQNTDSHATGLNVELSTIMRTAWAVRKSENISMSCALKLAWKSFKLKLRMKTEVVKFAFRKIDGTLREAVGTLVSDMLPKRDESTQTKERAKNYGVQVYFDLDRNCFRSFKVASLLLN